MLKQRHCPAGTTTVPPPAALAAAMAALMGPSARSQPPGRAP
jgi:hypothetical protein